jgi:peptide/nickel transport system ATP-binding protein
MHDAPARRADADLVTVQDLTCAFQSERTLPWVRRPDMRAVDGVSFGIARGETLGIVGESGCGKSTLGRLMVGLQMPTAGTVRFDGEPVRAPEAMPAALRHRLQMIFQDPYASLNPRWRVGAIVAEPLRVQRTIRDRAARRERVACLLRLVGLDEADMARRPGEFSGGQRQRIAIARALASGPEFLVCDEPTSALDVSVQAQVLNLMCDLQARLGLTVLFISHNLAVIRYVSQRVGVMYFGRLVELAPTTAFFGGPRHPYSRMLLDSLPDLDGARSEDAAPAIEPPDPFAPPVGCSFHPRCPLAMPVCRRVAPELRRDAVGGAVACHAADMA